METIEIVETHWYIKGYCRKVIITTKPFPKKDIPEGYEPLGNYWIDKWLLEVLPVKNINGLKAYIIG